MQRKQTASYGAKNTKKSQRLLCEVREVRYRFIQQQQSQYPVKTLCWVMKVSVSAFYAHQPKTTDTKRLGLEFQIKILFQKYKKRIGSRTLVTLLQQAGYTVGRYQVRSIMRRCDLVCQQRQAYKVATRSNKKHLIQPNLLNQNFTPLAQPFLTRLVSR